VDPGDRSRGIATQNVVERLLGKEGTTRFDVGRDAFVERVREYVRDTGGVILQQIRALGASCDWSRTYYTFSDQLSRAVRETFVAWYQNDLIYRGKYIINWCPRCLTGPFERRGREAGDQRHHLAGALSARGWDRRRSRSRHPSRDHSR
jgi:valyl-tRNA synthetase